MRATGAHLYVTAPDWPRPAAQPAPDPSLAPLRLWARWCEAMLDGQLLMARLALRTWGAAA